MKAFGSLDELYGISARVAHLKLRGAATLGARLARASRVGVPRAAPDAHRLRPAARRRGRRTCAPSSRICRASAGLYDRLGFGPFLRRQGERLAQLPLPDRQSAAGMEAFAVIAGVAIAEHRTAARACRDGTERAVAGGSINAATAGGRGETPLFVKVARSRALRGARGRGRRTRRARAAHTPCVCRGCSPCGSAGRAPSSRSNGSSRGRPDARRASAASARSSPRSIA